MTFNWIRLKIMDSLFSFVKDHMQNKLIWVLGFRYWFGNPLLIYALTKCIGVKVFIYATTDTTFFI